MTRTSLLEPIGKYVCGAWIPQTFEAALNGVERAKIVALRLQTGCCKPFSVERLRELSATDSLREQAIKAASVLLERNARLEQTCQLLSKDEKKKTCRISRYKAKELGETRLAQLGIFPLGRLPFAPFTQHEVGRPLPATVKFFYTDCSRSDPVIRRQKAKEFLGNLERCDVEIWTDGSVGSPTAPYPINQPWPISIRCDKKWYTAKSTPLTLYREDIDCVKKYRLKHRGPPSHLLFYDDGETHAVHFESSAGQIFVVDEDQDRLLCYRPEFRSVGGRGYIIHHKKEEEVIKKTVAAGLVCTSFSAELRAAICAFEQILKSPRTDAHYRWIVDCQGICGSLERFGKQDRALIHILRCLITSLTKDTGASLDVVWISSHCGLQGNEEADKLVKMALQSPLADQLMVPIEFSDAKAVIRAARKKHPEDIE